MVSADQLHRELDAFYRSGEEARMKRRRELLSLRSTLAPMLKSLDETGKFVDFENYQLEIRKVFGTGQVTTPDVVKIQAQLCHALHFHEIQLKQSHIYKRRNKHLTKFLQKEIKGLTTENNDRQQKLVRQVEEVKNLLKEQSKTLKTKIELQDNEIKQLRDQLGVADLSLMSPKSRVSSVSESLHTMMEKISFEELKKKEVYHPVLDVTTTPTCLSKSKLWNDMKKYDTEMYCGQPAASSRQSTQDNKRSLLELINCDDSLLSPTSQDIKKLSAEVFSL